MDSYISHKVFRLSVLVYSLFLPFTPINAFSAGEKNDQTKTERKFLNKSQDQANNEEGIDGGMIAHNIQRISNVLSSSPSQLTEQAKSYAKSYALGKINHTISSEAQKWLSQLGTANIDFSLDHKGKLDRGSLDLLLPLYDNQADWLLFSQLGYRNSDNRHTINLGLGGRYFTPDWMYGLNTFFDHDVTGRNQRLGLGGEAWTDYVKLSANTYWRLSQWRQSPKEQDYEERPANGFDLNSEFFLPAYPNLGGHLAYEQYFGDNVALFNRDTKQKSPSLARIGLNYTPIPLVTMGVDYKLGNSNHSETLFRANLNYRFGVPLGTQLSPDNVASMRTLAGSRYDLVQRNNKIVLDYKKKPELTLSLPGDLRGYSGQLVRVTPNVTTNTSLKSIHWTPGDRFKENGGLMTSLTSSHDTNVILPKYNANAGDEANTYLLSAIAEGENGTKSKAAHMNLRVEPFVIKDQSIEPSDGDLFSYDLAATITYGNENNPPVKGAVIPDVKWTLDPPNDQAKLIWDPTGELNEQGQLTASLTSTEPLHQDTKVYLAMDGMPKVEIKGDNPLVFSNIETRYNVVTYSVEPTGPLSTRDKNNIYRFKTTLSDKEGYLIKNRKIMSTWSVKQGNDDLKNDHEVTFTPGTSTDDKGQLIATLQSTKELNNVIVTLTLGEQQESFDPVSFVDDSRRDHITAIRFDNPGPYVASADTPQTVKVTLVDKDGNPYKSNASISHLQWFTEPGELKDKGFHIKPANGASIFSTGPGGILEVSITNTHAMKDIKLGFSIADGPVFYSEPFEYTAPIITAKLKEPIDVLTIPASDQEKGGKLYKFKVKVVDDKKGEPLKNQSIKDVTWSTLWQDKPNHLPKLLEIQKPQDAEDWTTDDDGYLTAYLARKEGSKGGINDLAISVTVGSDKPLQSHTMNVAPVEQPTRLRLSAKGDRENGVYTDYNPEDSKQHLPGFLTAQTTLRLLRPEDGQEINPDLRQQGKGMQISLRTDPPKNGLIVDNAELTVFVAAIEKNPASIWNVKVIASLTDNTTGESSEYSYLLQPYFYAYLPNYPTDNSASFNDNHFTVPLNGKGKNETCENMSIQLNELKLLIPVTPTIYEIGSPGSSVSEPYVRQFGPRYKWAGIYPPLIIRGNGPNKTFNNYWDLIKIRNLSGSSDTPYSAYSLSEWKLEPGEDDKALLFCLISMSDLHSLGM
ncbi:putative invasin [Xenorhabdus beddingii]|uniref:Putative invasin n=1 Tax=Xenorhabdus beddingii TaxID=40578 RepID=A0A1Y2SRG5_9GAMM|nr:inverse autotransporter beta domain-containing protein [Xenorhabdus beddingii]OTA20842.1 putative invasin [Xenorhabdus beddingii]